MYNWEASAKANRKKIKKTGTVIFHPDETVELSYERLLKEVPVASANSDPADNENPEDELASRTIVKSALITGDTATALTEVMRFDGLLPCQAQCYRGIFNRRDVILHSRTGSGKTLAYALPIIERHLLLEVGKKRLMATADGEEPKEGPFLLIFVFSNDLAVQTKGVLAKIYPAIRIGVAGFDPSGVYDILIGTVRKLDESIRGRKVAAAETALEEKAKTSEARMLAAHRKGGGAAAVAAGGRRKRARQDDSANDKDGGDSNADDSDSDSDDDDANTNPQSMEGDVSACNVRAIVIDEVDTTLGPRFSNVGRRMKNLLKYIRKANGSLAEGLLADYRAHHYVLCGATIPNWVIKAGFLGVKKYYYQLVTVGTEKLPEGLACYELACPMNRRVEAAMAMLTAAPSLLGRVVVFGTNKQIDSIDQGLQKQTTGKGASAAVAVARVLTPGKTEVERIASMEDYNREAASVLLCTDIAARGLDFTAVDTVLMLSVPHGTMAAETFVHRAGRTARVNRTGQCILMCDASEAAVVDMICKSAHVVFKKYLHAPACIAGDARGSSNNSTGKRAKKGAVAAAVTDSGLTHFQLTVKNQLRFSRPDVAVPTAREVLAANLSDELRAAAMKDAAEVGGSTEVVRFAVPAAVAHEVKQKLWKYNLKEVAQ